MTSVLVCDDHAVFRAGLRSILNSMPGFDVIGEVASGEGAIQLLSENPIDLVILDIQMPGMGGLASIGHIKALAPETHILVLTMHEDEATILAALAAGACSYLVKGAGYEEVATAIAAASTGETVLGPAVANFVLTALAGHHSGLNGGGVDLTEREREVLGLLADGRSTQQAARALCISPKTVRNHVSAVMTKLDVPDRAQAIAWARTGGLKRLRK